MLELRLLGVPQVRLDGRVLTFKRLGSISLLAYLVLSNRTHAREVIASMLAGDNPDDQARKLLSNLLVDLRKQLGDYVVATRKSVRFNRTRPHTLDVVSFQTSACDDGRTLAELEAAIDLYRGEFLEGLCPSTNSDFESWLSVQREELRSVYLQLLHAHMDASLELGNWDRGIQSARRIIAQEPWQEETHRQLIIMLARSGQRHAAIGQYLACRRLLREEMGVDPSCETVALFNRVRRATVRPPHNLPHPTIPLVGRALHVHRLGKLLADPDCQLVSITGLAGSGKSALALHVARGFAPPDAPPPEQPFPDGVFQVNFTQVGPYGLDSRLSSAAATRALVATLDSTLLGSPACVGGDALPRVIGHLSGRAMLLVLDNFDQVAAAASLLPKLLVRAPHLKLLVTSRAPLHVADERVLHIDALQLPATEHEIESAEASALFLQEARRVALDYKLTDRERSPLVRLCQLLGGFPLALVLAARWTPLLPCSAVARELQSGMGLDVLTTTDSDLPERHRSMTSILETALAELQCDDRTPSRLLAIASTGRTTTGGGQLRSLTHELIPQLRALDEHGLLHADPALGTVELHPLLRAYLRTATDTASAPDLVA